MSASTTPLLVGVASIILGGGGIGSIVALLKLKPEGDQIIVSSARDVVVIQRGVIEDMEKRAEEQRKRMDDMETALKEQQDMALLSLAAARDEAARLRVERDAERVSNAELRYRIEVLEAEVAKLHIERESAGQTPSLPPKSAPKT